MKQFFVTLTFLMTIIGLVGCDGTTIRKQDVGLVTGGVLGGLVGSQIGGGTGRIVAATAGAILGGLVGQSVGAYMDQQDRIQVNQALESTRTNQTTRWTNPDTGRTYAITPVKTYRSGSGQPCRDFTTEAVIKGKVEKLYGRACRDAQGHWRVVR